MTTGPNKATKMASFTRRDLRKAALKLINKAKRDGPLNALYDLKHGVDRALRDLNDPKRPRMVCKCRLELEISVLKEIKKELVGMLFKSPSLDGNDLNMN